MSNRVAYDSEPRPASGFWNPHRRLWKWLGISSLIALAVIAVVAAVMLHYAGPILKGRVIETLSVKFQSRVELAQFNVSLAQGLAVSGDGLRIFPTEKLMAAGVTAPLIAVDHFSFHSGVLGLFFKPTHVRSVQVTGLHINVPPAKLRPPGSGPFRSYRGKIKIIVDEIICDRSQLIIANSNPDKDPKDFELRRIVLRDVGPEAPWKYNATLTNAVPRGEIRCSGSFGPWQTETPGDSSVTGDYTFDHADLNTITGIGGILSSTGQFKGRLDRIEVDGTTHTPEFSLDTSGRPVPLDTSFHAIVDGTTGDTYLQPVQAQLRNARFTVTGAVINIKGVGHRIDLDADVPGAPIEDFLELVIKTEPPVLSGIIQTKTKLHIPPGKESVSHRLGLDGNFALTHIHFSNPKVQDRVDMLSLRAQGRAKEAKTGAEDVASRMSGRFQLGHGVLRFRNLVYSLPGARVQLTGVYSLNGQQFDFFGHVLTQASLSHLVASWWKSLLLRPVSPFFRGKDGGADIPVKISGTQSEPKFGLDLFHRDAKPKDRH